MLYATLRMEPKTRKTQVQKYVRVLELLECLTMVNSNNSNKKGGKLTHLTHLTTLTDISVLTTLTTLTTKDILLLQLLEPNTLTNISNKTNIKLQTICAMIEFKSRGSGLLIDNLVELSDIKKAVNYYVTTMKGINHLISILEYEVNRRKEQETIQMEGLNTKERIDKFQTFFKRYNIKDEQKLLNIDFNDLSKFSPELSEFLLDDPEDCLGYIKEVLKNDYEGIKVRFHKLPKSRKINIREMRSKHLNLFYELEGVVKQKSDIRPQTTSAKFECPSCGAVINILQLESSFKEPTRCLPKGTLIHTPNGLLPIEKANKVLCLDYEGNLIIQKSKIINSGKQKQWAINEELFCSGDHMWFVLRDGKCRFLPTKHLNKSDVLLKIYGKNMCGLPEEVSTSYKDVQKKRQGGISNKIFGKKNLFSRMQNKTFLTMSKGHTQGRNEYRRNSESISKQKIIGKGHIRKVDGEQKNSIFSVKGEGNRDKKLSRTKKNRYNHGENNLFKGERKPELQAWREMWGRILQEDCKRDWKQQMSFLWNRKKFNSSSQGFEPPESPYYEYCDTMQFVPYEISRISETDKTVEMYDLQVPDYNNFILKNNILSHNCGCGRKGKFRLLSKELIDAQGLVLEEEPYELDAGQQPKRLNIFLKDDLVSPISDKKTEVGTKIRITGTLKEVPIITRQGTKSTRFDLMFEANHVEQMGENISSLELKGDDKKNIIEVSQKDNVFEILTNSLLPNVQGHKEVKEGLLLQQMGGVKKERDGSKIRGDTHIILVGDPGVAKTKILKRISEIAPKASFISGTGTSKVGYTASVVKDEFFKGGWSLEAGPMVLMNNGGVCIDEMDKGDKEDLKSLHTPMSQQIVPINKANINATLKSETWVLANANPKFGRFDPFGIISEQLDFSITLLNRFDVIFVIKDIPDKKKDSDMAKFILDMHKGKKKKEVERIDDELLRKYISYARKQIKPELSDEASEVIEKFYVDMRSSDQNETVKNVAINARQIDGLVRLSEASAKIRLSKEVTKEDATRATDLLLYTLKQIGIDPNTGKIDIDRISTGISASSRDVFSKVINIVKKLEDDFGEIIPIEEIIKLADQYGINEESVDDAISKLKMKGDLFAPVNGKISRNK